MAGLLGWDALGAPCATDAPDAPFALGAPSVSLTKIAKNLQRIAT
jgi:hypothetical protein